MYRKGLIPIVMGAHPADYARIAPPNSFIHVDWFQGPRELAEFLHLLDSNDTLYNRFFEWRDSYEMINTQFYCRLCFLANFLKHEGAARPENWKNLHEGYSISNLLGRDNNSDSNRYIYLDARRWWQNFEERFEEPESLCIGKNHWLPPIPWNQILGH